MKVSPPLGFLAIALGTFLLASARAAELPAILEQPLSQTVVPGGIGFLRVKVAMAHPATNGLQWQFNGQDLPGKTRPLLAITNASVAQSGEYRLILRSTNLLGQAVAKTSQVARVTVQTIDAPPRLSLRRAEGANVLLDIEDEPGTSHYIEFRDTIDKANLYWPVAHSALPVLLATPRPNGFFRAQRLGFASPVCNLNLRQIYFAAIQWGSDYAKPLSTSVNLGDLAPYIDGTELKCPEGGVYHVTSTGGYPQCTLPLHFLESLQ